MRSGRNYLVLLLIMIFAVPVFVFGDSSDGVITLQIGSKTATVGGVNVELDAEPIVHNSRTMVPLRFIADAFGAATSWDGETRTVTIEPNEPKIARPNIIERDFLEILKKAQKSVKFAAKSFMQWGYALEDAAANGVQVQLLVEFNHDTELFLESIKVSENLEIKLCCQSEIIDNEFAIIDDEYVFYGGSNMFSYWENNPRLSNVLLIENASLAKSLSISFGFIWDELPPICAKGFLLPTDILWETKDNFIKEVYDMSITDDSGTLVVAIANDLSDTIKTLCIDTDNGEKRCKIVTANRYYQGFACGNSVIYGACKLDGSVDLTMINPATGEKLWKYNINKPIKYEKGKTTDQNRAVHVWGDRVVVGTEDGFDMIDLESGDFISSYEKPGFLPYAVTGCEKSSKEGLMLLQEKDNQLVVGCLEYNFDDSFRYSEFEFEVKSDEQLKDGEKRYLIDCHKGKVAVSSVSDGKTQINILSPFFDCRDYPDVHTISGELVDLELTSRYVFYTNILVRTNPQTYHFVSYDLKSNQTTQSWLDKLPYIIGFDDVPNHSMLLAGSENEMVCFEVIYGLLAPNSDGRYADYLWAKDIKAKMSVNSETVLYDARKQEYYFVVESNSDSPTYELVKYGCR
ncbi:MAG TPA: stalk domain-containing protein [Caldisericia bacterium]|nr:stalk domain-containing protein [Caldisericia bacterium]HPF49767.1 stalk domain-containing protein [Caldisericia bacterium]HPI84328.1 stalk domain-containing protein [Caldisericia bacterium]HPQ93755.1 stalk domain-containing protein [Caldisericia bacterium]HRV74821.1 stalk domain-containing protein [Caldisericia bacterium]